MSQLKGKKKNRGRIKKETHKLIKIRVIYIKNSEQSLSKKNVKVKIIASCAKRGFFCTITT